MPCAICTLPRGRAHAREAHTSETLAGEAPEEAAAAEPEGGEEGAVAAPLVLELVRDQWSRLKGYRWLRLRQQIIQKLIEPQQQKR